jgi:hypothetical protein
MLIASSSVMVHDFDVPGRPFAPLKTYPALIFDADTMLPAPIAVRGFQPIAGRSAQIVELFGRVDGKKFAPDFEFDSAEP